MSRLGISTLLFLAVCLNPLFVSADEIVVECGDRNVSVGDFDCAGCSSEVTNALRLLMSQKKGQLTAGELWQFFDAQGIRSVEQLTLCLDLDPSDHFRGNVGLSGITLQIEDPNSLGDLITNASIGENSLIVPEYEISSFKPEARLHVALGYDFMKQFTADSQAKIQLGFTAPGSSVIAPRFAVEGSETSLVPASFNWVALIGFVGFWVLVFFLLNRVTRPKQEAESAIGQPSSRQQLAT